MQLSLTLTYRWLTISCCYLSCFAMLSGALVFAFAVGVLSRTAVRNVLPVPYTALVSCEIRYCLTYLLVVCYGNHLGLTLLLPLYNNNKA
jgi:hypothetical protein